MTPKMVEPDLDPIALVDDEPPTPLPPAPIKPLMPGAPAVPGAIGAPVAPGAAQPAQASKIRAFSVAASHQHNINYKRKTNVTGSGICRMRTFHGRLSDEGLAFMDDKINEWLDANPDIEVKFVTSTIGMYDGKIKEPALVMNVWY
jgi:hypothetical protein